jgi:hypothetical protein
MHVDTLLLSGGPAHEICATAETQNADLIVMSTHGHTGLKRFALGRVTENVVRHAPCPCWMSANASMSSSKLCHERANQLPAITSAWVTSFSGFVRRQRSHACSLFTF